MHQQSVGYSVTHLGSTCAYLHMFQEGSTLTFAGSGLPQALHESVYLLRPGRRNLELRPQGCRQLGPPVLVPTAGNKHGVGQVLDLGLRQRGLQLRHVQLRHLQRNIQTLVDLMHKS